MKTNGFFVILIAIILIAVVVAPTSAQIVQSAPRPFMPVENPATPEPVKGGINIHILSGWGTPIPDASVTISPMSADRQTGEMFPDPSIGKTFERCGENQKLNCLRDDGTGTLLEKDLPQAGSQRELDFRGEATSFTHDIQNVVRVVLDKGQFTDVYIYMFWNGFEAGKPYAYQGFDWNGNWLIAGGFWARKDVQENALVDFFWKTSSEDKVQVKYPSSRPISAKIGPGPDGNGTWIEVQFYSVRDVTAYFGGSICGEIQVRSADKPGKVLAQFKDVCVKMRRPDWVSIGDKR